MAVTEGLARLREPFPPEQVGLLPRVTCKDCSNPKVQCQKHDRRKCDTCQAFVSAQHIHLDYVGHGAVTDRLLEVDPEWNWEPLAFDQNGLPLFAYEGGNPAEFWIKLTVCGVTRLGVGTCPADQKDAPKVLIGDALRNAAMRFGVALDLWVKGHAEDSEQQSSGGTRDRSPQPVETFVADSGEVIDVWPGEVKASTAKRELLVATGDDKESAAKAWKAAGWEGAWKVPRADLDALTALLAGQRRIDEAPAVVDGERIDARAVGMRANAVFAATIPPDQIPRGKKTWLFEALRHALVYAVTDGEVSSASDADGEQLFLVWQQLDAIAAGEVTFEFNARPNAGVDWHWPDGSKTTVLWTELTIAEATAEAEKRAVS